MSDRAAQPANDGEGAPPTVLPVEVYGAHQSFFTRKVTGYLDYKRLPWRWRRGLGMSAEVRAGGWPGGLPAVIDSAGTVLWDSTALILYFDHHHRDRSVLPDDPTQRFLAHVLEDFNDEWLYRPAVGTRWLYPNNTLTGSWDLARDGAFEAPIDAHALRDSVTTIMTASLPRLGTTPANIGSFVEESLKPWLRALSTHLGPDQYVFGDRPSLADFAFYGGNAAHFVSDFECRRWADAVGPNVVRHTQRLTEPGAESFGDWSATGEVPDTLVAVLAELGRHYLPWVTEATVNGSATITFDDGERAEIATTPFLDRARSMMLARYRAARTDELDEVLATAGIRSYYADHLDQAGEVPDPAPLPRPADNRPYPAVPPDAQ
jgi:glutathione S-transferase